MRGWQRVLTLLAIGLLIHGTALAEELDLEGIWLGKMKAGGTELLMVFHVSRGDDGSYTATLDSPDQGASGIPVSDVGIIEGVVRFVLSSVGGSFEGHLRDDGALAGEWRQGGQALPLVLERSDAAPPSKPGRDPDQIWQGTLAIPGAPSLRLVFRAWKTDDGASFALLDTPDQGATGIPVTSASIEAKKVRFEVKSVGGIYEGTLQEDGKKIDGTWSQGGGSLPLALEKVDAAPEIGRPQEPEKPYPYREEEVAYDSRAAGILLAGTLTTPRTKGPFAAVLLISGSGPQDRDETVFGHRPFLVLADHLTRRGIAVLRVDDRGVGGSTGSLSTSTTEDLAQDVLAGVDYLKARDEIDGERIGLIGHSEGGLIGPMVATRSPDVAFLVLLAGPGLDGEQILYLQGAALGRAAGWDEESIAKYRSFQQKTFAVIKDEKDRESARAGVRRVMTDAMAALSEEERRTIGLVEGAVDAHVEAVVSPWFRYFLTYDPLPTLRQVKCPILVLNGELDRQVPAKQNLRAIEDALSEGGNDRFEIHELASLNHLFQSAETGTVDEYGASEETFAPQALQLISDWLLKQTASKRAEQRTGA